MQLTIRSFQKKDLSEIKALFVNTVHHINIRDYSQEQVDAWAPKSDGGIQWEDRIHPHNGFVALLEGRIVGFATLDEKGYIDFLYVHHQHQASKIGTYLYTRLEIEAEELGISKLTTHASHTAKPFFEKMGFTVIAPNAVIKNGVRLENWILEKRLTERALNN